MGRVACVRQGGAWHTEVGRALRRSDDCSYHSALVSKYGIVAGVGGCLG